MSITATNPAWGTGGYFSGDKTVNTTGGTSITLNATNVMNQSGYLQIKSGGSFQSTTTKGEYIKSIAVDYQANNSYQILASVNGSSWTSIGTWNADHTATFTQSNGYKYFKIAASGGYTQLNSVTVQYYVVSVVDVTGIHSQPESYYVGETPNVNDFSLDVLMSDDTTSTVTPTSITLDTSTAGSNISGTATYSGASGTKTAAFTINIINRLVTGITVNLSTSSVSVGGTASATATITPSNATIKTVTWSSSDTSVATINSSTGAISAVAAGTCTFTAAATDGSGVTGTSTTFTVTSTPSKTLSSISLNTSGCTRVFNLGASFSYTGLIVTANYSDSTSATVTPTSVSSPTMTTAGEKTITVSYTESGTTKTATYKIIVNPEATFNSTNNSGGVSSYSNSWTNTTGGFTWNITNANNNNNGWNYIKMGSKNAAYVGTISTSAAVSYKVASVKVTIDAITSGSVNSITLYTSSNGSSWTSAGTFSKSTGTQTVTISSPSTSKYYRVSFDCAKSSNGVVTISKVQLVGTY